jgi:hypothetical protein
LRPLFQRLFKLNRQLLRQDKSNSHFAAMALDQAILAGFDVKDDTLAGIAKFWMSRQKTSGGWSYAETDQASPTMTCAGAACLAAVKLRLGDKNSSRHDEAIARGVAWLNNEQLLPDSGATWFFYHCHALSRAGSLAGHSNLSGQNWRTRFTQLILSRQQSDGHFTGSSAETPRFATSFASLALTAITDADGKF